MIRLAWLPRALASVILAIVLPQGLVARAGECHEVSEGKASIEAFFSPWDDALKQVLMVLDGACEQILVQAYVLSSRDVANHLIAAHQRGIDVRILADARQHAETPASLLQQLAENGIPVWLESRYRHAHNKVMVVDARSSRSVIITGSYNFTWSAQHLNAENLLILRGYPTLAARYADNWVRHQAAAEPLRVAP